MKSKKVNMLLVVFLILCGLEAQAKEIPASKVVIEVNDTKITYAQYKMAFDYHLNLYREKYGKFPKEWEDELKKVVINGLICETLLLQEAEKIIKVTDEEIKQRMKDAPEFKDSKGNFDKEKYRMALANHSINWNKIYERHRRYLLKTKLEKMIKNKVAVSEEEIRKKFCEENEKIRIKYVLIKFEEDKISIGTITDSEIETYYNKNIKLYQEPEQVRAKHILITPDNDKKAAKSKIEGILKEIKAGGNFEELAKEHSACPSKTRGGDLGFFGRGRMVKPFEEAAFSLKVGEISDVVETSFGFHIIKLEEKKDPRTIPLSEAKEGIKNSIYNQKQREEAEKIAKAKADEIYNKIIQDFEATVKEYSLEVNDSDLIEHHQPVKELGYCPELEQMFNLKPKQISKPIKIWQGIIIAQLIEKQIDEEKYAKEKETIKQNILNKKRENALENWYQNKKTKANIKINL
ncbi:MAG: peptidylprolyl isomerase [bacterium]